MPFSCTTQKRSVFQATCIHFTYRNKNRYIFFLIVSSLESKFSNSIFFSIVHINCVSPICFVCTQSGISFKLFVCRQEIIENRSCHCRFFPFYLINRIASSVKTKFTTNYCLYFNSMHVRIINFWSQ